MTIVNNVEGELNLSNVTSSSPNFKAEIAPLESGKKYELTVSLIPPVKSGNNSGKISMDTGLTDVPKLEVTAYAFVTAPVDVTPANLALPRSRTTDLQRQFYIRSNINQPIKISELKSTSPALQLTLKDIKQGQTYRLSVDIPITYKPPPGGDKITFKTDNPSVPLITIPITDRSNNKASTLARRTKPKPKRQQQNITKQNAPVKATRSNVDSIGKKVKSNSVEGIKDANKVIETRKNESAGN